MRTAVNRHLRGIVLNLTDYATGALDALLDVAPDVDASTLDSDSPCHDGS